MAHRGYQEELVVSAAVADGIGNIIDVRDYRTIMLSFATASSGNMTAKIKGSIRLRPEDVAFGSAQSATNHWTYVEAVDANDGTIVDGDVGFAVSGTDLFTTYEVNVEGLTSLTVDVSSWVAGSLTVIAGLFE